MGIRKFAIVLGSALIALSLIGILLNQHKQEKDRQLQQLELLQQQQLAKAQEEQARARAVEAELKAQEIARELQQKKEKAEAAAAAKAEAENRKAQEIAELKRQQELARQKEEDAERASMTVAGEGWINAYNRDGSSKEVAVARVHAGDEVMVEIQRPKDVDVKIFAGIGQPPSPYRRPTPLGPFGEKSALNLKLKDQDRFVITQSLTKLKPFWFSVERAEGAELYFGTGSSQAVQPGSNGLDGRIVFKFRIIGNNRWKMMPIIHSEQKN
jgi:hypothetical protein